jgi:membrane-bound lytic murein transglycosylase D
MTRRLLAIFAAALVQACAGTLPPPEPEAQPVPEAPAPAQPLPAAAQPADPVPPPVPPTAVVPIEAPKEVIKPVQKQVEVTAGPQDVWERVRQGFAIPDLKSDLVRKHMAYYAARPDYLQRVFDRSRLYLYHIVGEIERRGLPTELALLPMVESAFNPMAYSRAHASGLWQFIPGTGKRFELEQNWWYDGRRGIVESTDAALD